MVDAPGWAHPWPHFRRLFGWAIALTVAAGLLLALSACQTATGTAGASLLLNGADGLVGRYCDRPEAVRNAYRAILADHLHPHRIEVHCGVPAPTGGS